MITLYQFSTSPFTEKVRRALNYEGLGFEVHEVARAKVAEGDYKHVSATGTFPAIPDRGVKAAAQDLALDHVAARRPCRFASAGESPLAHRPYDQQVRAPPPQCVPAILISQSTAIVTRRTEGVPPSMGSRGSVRGQDALGPPK